MLQSMTAFARVSSNFSGIPIEWELRSVNHRFLEMNFRLPERIRPLEMMMRQTLRDHLDRGKVDVNLSLDFSSFQCSPSEGLSINQSLVERLMNSAKEIQSLTKIQSNLNLETLLTWPGVLVSKEVDVAALEAFISENLKQAVLELKQARQREGEKLGKQIAQKLNEIESGVSRAKERVSEVKSQLKGNLLQRLEKLHREIQSDLAFELSEARLEQEVLFYLQKMDVSEELDRLEIHLQEARRLLTQPGSVGRKFDFLLQEFNREANTLSSKSPDSALTKIAVDLKLWIEQIREQIQNVE